jgi:uncharacterized protein YceK
MKIKSILIILVFAVTLLSGCVGQETRTYSEEVTSACVDECKAWLNAGKDMSNGPCLLNPIKDMPDWVCDVAHSPRQSVDDNPNNQCSAFGEGRANHFVEVNPNCELIKTW